MRPGKFDSPITELLSNVNKTNPILNGHKIASNMFCTASFRLAHFRAVFARILF